MKRMYSLVVVSLTLAVLLMLLLAEGAASGSPPPASSQASATARTGVVRGHVYDYDGNPVAAVEVQAGVVDDQGNELWGGSGTTDASGFYSVSGAPATTHGVLQGTTGSDEWLMWDLTFADPGTSTYDVRLGRVA